jgi:hypothetical protein
MGRPWGGGRPLPVNFLELDVRWLKREGLLRPGASGDVRHLLNGRLRAETGVRVREGEIAVTFGLRCEPVGLRYTKQPLGGRRAWFECPGCGGRAAILYGWPFRCRRCRGLAYPSQREDHATRASRRVQWLRRRVGGTGNLLEPFPERPKGMHRSTYWRLMSRTLSEETRAYGLIAERISRLARA